MATKKTTKNKNTKKNTATVTKEPEVVYVNKKRPAWRNIWFWLFTVLFVSLIFAGTYLFGLVNQPNQQTEKILDQQLKNQQASDKQPANFDLALNKQQANSIIANYLKNENLKDITSQINDQNKFVVAGTAKVAGSSLKYYINFDIAVVDSKVELTATDAKIGSADVPVQVALTLIKDNLKEIKNVDINPIDSKVTINAENIRLDANQNISFKIKSADFDNDRIDLVGTLK